MSLFSPEDIEDTIVAIGTPHGRGAISIIRLSGRKARKILDTVFLPAGRRNNIQDRKICYGRLIDPTTKTIIDHVMVTFLSHPRTYTGEDMGEISFHGSPVLAGQILEIVCSQGARLAHPGEYTMRAFLNGKLDLTQAEAVRDLIESRTIYQAQVAERQLEGSVSKKIKPLKDTLIEIISTFETSVEFSDQDIELDNFSSTIEKLCYLRDELNILIKGFDFGRIVKQGFTMAITGVPNVGKSSLFNRFLGVDRAIVTETAGTTRDLLREEANIEGIPITFIDTAGIRHSEDLVEKIGVQRSYTAMAEADIILHVIDISTDLTEHDIGILEKMRSEGVIIALNKADLKEKLGEEEIKKNLRCKNIPILTVSAKTGKGFNELSHTILEMVTPSASSVPPPNMIIANLRQQECIKNAKDAIESAIEAFKKNLSEEFILVHLYEGLKKFNDLTGETTVGDILKKIFSTFCIGK